jgi:hypothetical protein
MDMMHYYKLSAHNGRIELHITRSEARKLFNDPKILHKSKRGHRSYHVALIAGGKMLDPAHHHHCDRASAPLR